MYNILMLGKVYIFSRCNFIAFARETDVDIPLCSDSTENINAFSTSKYIIGRFVNPN